ncbi:MAG: hypothetical protein M1824_000353 [Vezdaea acicularis]|nr:MAG: hypothetical protein M1824_000353 [Vezdaea acicularis]
MPKVTSADYEYITEDDVDHRDVSGDLHKDQHVSQSRKVPLSEDDIVLVQHNGVNFPLHFPKYAIDDRVLKVGDLRERFGSEISVSNLRRIQLFYKGSNLRDDSRSCRDMGLKTDSIVVAEVEEGSEEDGSGSDGDEFGTDQGDAPVKRKRNRNRNKKKKKSSANTAGAAAPNLEVPQDSSRGGSSRSSSRAPSPTAPKTASETIDDLSSRFNVKFLPECIQYTSHPPTDPAKRDFEHKRISETILSDILFKLDAVDTGGDPEIRQKRKDLVVMVNGVLSKLDEAAKMK